MTSRRRVLTILAGAAVLPVLNLSANAAPAQWRGVALGAKAHIVLDHPDAQRLIDLAVAEIQRLETIFSLYKTDSELAQLNANGLLENPSFEMLELLSIASQVNARTNGSFDPSVQPLWALFAEHVAAGTQPSEGAVSTALGRVGWKNVSWTTTQVSFAKREMKLTLNGIAQGFIADKIAALLRSHGVENVLINTGEISALGVNHEGDAWSVGVKNQAPVRLLDRAIATSAPLGTTFDQAGSLGHILDPRRGITRSNWSQISVTSTSACRADALSTAFCIMPRDEIMRAIDGTNDEVILVSV